MSFHRPCEAHLWKTSTLSVVDKICRQRLVDDLVAAGKRVDDMWPCCLVSSALALLQRLRSSQPLAAMSHKGKFTDDMTEP